MSQNKSARRMLLAAFFAQNLALGFTYGTYGTFVEQFAEEFKASRTLTASGLAIIALVVGVTSPWVGRLVNRHPIGKVMASGGLVIACGFALAGLAPSISIILLAHAVLGLGVSLLGPIPAMTLASSWYPNHTGKAIGLVMVQLGIFVMPPVAAALIVNVGWRPTYFLFALVLLACMPILRSIKTRPEEPSEPETTHIVSKPAVRNIDRELLLDSRYWAATLAAGILVGAAVTISTHLVPYGVQAGHTLQSASFVMSVQGAMTMAGSFLFGWLSDRFNGSSALTINALFWIVAWSLLWFDGSIHLLFLAAVFTGACAGGVYPALSAYLAKNYGRKRFSQALGLASAINVPMTFGMPPLMGMLFDLSGSYSLASLTMAVITVPAAIVFMVLAGMRTPSLANETF